MNVTTENKKLMVLLKGGSQVIREFGPLRGKILMQRVRSLMDANTLEDVRMVPGHFHELVGNRKGQWSCDLDQPYRLIFEPHEEPIPTDKDGKYVWIEIKGVELIEITNYHGK